MDKYESPTLESLGKLGDITRQGGVDATDVPMGTPNTGPGSVTGSL